VTEARAGTLDAFSKTKHRPHRGLSGGPFMQLARKQETWNPFREIEELSDRFNRLFGLARSANGGQQALTLSDWSPACDITESKEGYRVVAELPNVKKDDISVSVENGVLAIRGERKEEKEEKDVKVHRRELSYGSFMRSFTLPDDADVAKVDARFKDGTLTVTVAKSEGKKEKAKRVAVQ
jgi:HSP20 family protein